MREFFILAAAGCLALAAESLCVSFLSWLLRPRGTRQAVLIAIEGDCPDLESRLRWQLFRLEADPCAKDDLLLIIDRGAAGEARERAERLCRGRRNCRLCTESEAGAILGRDSVCKALRLVLY